ncbi:hypothetical protein SCH4B_0238 [Ruegeria sp. TrichCH4B]|nr:hypothetical protein SCH4B_0238 [Ruegeria sp. TrichCH4B]
MRCFFRHGFEIFSTTLQLGQGELPEQDTRWSFPSARPTQG